MKLIIDVPDKIYSMFYKTSTLECFRFNISKAIANGIPLDEIRAEISKQEIEYRKQNDRCGVGLDMALRIIEHIGDTE